MLLRRHTYGAVRFARVAIAGAGLLVCLLFVLQTTASAGDGGKKYYGFSAEMLPGGSDAEKSGTMPAEDLEEQQARKQELLKQMGYKEDIIKLQASGASREESPLKKPRSAARPVFAETPRVEISATPPEIENVPDYNEVIKEAVYRVGDIEFSAVEADDEALMHIPVGTTLMVQKGVAAARRAYSWIDGKVSEARKEASHKEIKIEIEDMPEEVRSSLQPLLEVQGVSVKVPGADYAVAKTSEKAPDMKYDVKEEMFTIEKISLEKTAKGELVVQVPPEVIRNFDEKKLCLSDEKDVQGKTVAIKLEEGDIKTLAKVLAAWARYSPSGFHFDADAEEKVAKAVIRIVGVGVEDAFVRLEEDEISSRALEDEISMIIGNDTEARDRIMKFIYPKASGNNLNVPYGKRRNN